MYMSDVGVVFGQNKYYNGVFTITSMLLFMLFTPKHTLNIISNDGL